MENQYSLDVPEFEVKNFITDCKNIEIKVDQLYKNKELWLRKSKDRLSDLYYSMAKAYRKEDFDYIMSKAAKIDHRIKEYLEEARYEKWSRSHSPINRGRMMTSSIAECINGFLVEVRKLRILGFIEEVRILFAAWNYKNNEIASYTKTTLGRRFEDILTLNGAKDLRMTVKTAASYLCCVYEFGRRYVVDIECATCNCGRHQIDEILYPHTIAVLKSKNIEDYGPYCSKFYRPNTIVKTYELPIILMPDMKD
ncbi:uncharacterized protein LOC107874194 [Capsicum annuum]|uniref:uncharacterized protein LOC107874194 n=1 Tax=Capsicum annuum TaxID=4072 RepID=UPI001FB09ED5|nr:uncharacterized protein LOC107874194 [Capsicum annuum]